MPEFELSPGVKMFYRDDDFTDPWRSPEAIVLLHGNSENSLAWNGWVPQLGRQFRVIRPEMRGFGKSTPMPEDYPWTVEGMIDDYLRLLDSLGIKRFHLVGAKIGALMAVRMSVNHPDRVMTLGVTGGRVISGGRAFQGKDADFGEKIRKGGVGAWARATMNGRLGSTASPEMLEWWIQMMDQTAVSTQMGYIKTIPNIDLKDDLPRIKCPTLVMTAEEGGNANLKEVRERVALIPRGELLILPGDSYHVAATYPEECARAFLDFIERTAAVPAGAKEA
jgi:3-oxoadipate enol-lactonase